MGQQSDYLPNTDPCPLLDRNKTDHTFTGSHVVSLSKCADLQIIIKTFSLECSSKNCFAGEGQLSEVHPSHQSTSVNGAFVEFVLQDLTEFSLCHAVPHEPVSTFSLHLGPEER